MWQCICLCWIKFNLTRFLDFYNVTTTYWTTRHKTKAEMLENVERVHFYLLEYMSHEQNVNSHLMVLQLTTVRFSFGGVQRRTVTLHSFSAWFHFRLKIVGILPWCAHCLTLWKSPVSGGNTGVVDVNRNVTRTGGAPKHNKLWLPTTNKMVGGCRYG